MIEVARHIETLLLESDCVIIPRLGGFVAHYQSATYLPEEGLFLPPSRVIGFNPQLRMNDGALVQSFMSVYGNSYAEASHMIDKKVDEMYDALHEEGRLQLPNVGELRYNIHGKYDFTPYDNQLATPHLYGLGSFEIKPLSELQKRPTVADRLPQQLKPLPPVEESPQKNEAKTVEMSIVRQEKSRIHRFTHMATRVAGIAAVVALLFLTYFMAEPVVNEQASVRNDYAWLVPEELLIPLETLQTPLKQPRPIVVREEKVPRATVHTPEHPKGLTKASENIQLKEVKEAPKAVNKRYHIVVASLATEKDMNEMVAKLKSQGYPEARALTGNGKLRVSIQSFATHAEATQAAAQWQSTYQGAWVLKQ